jgi:hypothetical protein
MKTRAARWILGVPICAWIAACASAPAPSQVGVVRGIAVDMSGNALPASSSRSGRRTERSFSR